MCGDDGHDNDIGHDEDDGDGYDDDGDGDNDLVSLWRGGMVVGRVVWVVRVLRAGGRGVEVEQCSSSAAGVVVATLLSRSFRSSSITGASF